MNDLWTCRNYESGDEFKIIELYKKAFSKEIDIESWKWKFMENPAGNGIIKLMFDGKKLIGHYAIIPVKMKIGDRIVKAALSMITMTHPDYTKQGIFTHLANALYEELSRMGFKFVYGFPNENSFPGFIKNLGWEDLGKGQPKILYKKNLDNLSVRHPKNAHRIEEFGNEIEMLWQKIKKNYKFIVPRTKEFLNWRFVTNPEVKYAKYVIRNNGEVVGYVVLKIYTGEGEPIGHMVDALATDSKVFEDLLRISYIYFTENGIKAMSCWIQDSFFYSEKLKEHGFVKGPAKNYFGIRFFKENCGDIGKVNCDEWYITMGDSDVF